MGNDYNTMVVKKLRFNALSFRGRRGIKNNMQNPIPYPLKAEGKLGFKRKHSRHGFTPTPGRGNFNHSVCENKNFF